MLRLYLAGAAAVGKTTTASMLGRLLNMPWIEVEAEHCWNLDSPEERQTCFLETFKSIIRSQKRGFFTNHVLTVYAYSAVLGVPHVAEKALTLALRDKEHLVVLAAEPKVIAARIQKRLSREALRRRNVVEEQLALHVSAQRALLEVAARYHIPVIDTSWLSPRQVAEKIASIVMRGARVA